jgi:bacterioferritin (cytochrome b1)
MVQNLVTLKLILLIDYMKKTEVNNMEHQMINRILFLNDIKHLRQKNRFAFKKNIGEIILLKQLSSKDFNYNLLEKTCFFC